MQHLPTKSQLLNWKDGDDVIIVPSVSDEEARESFPAGWETLAIFACCEATEGIVRYILRSAIGKSAQSNRIE